MAKFVGRVGMAAAAVVSGALLSAAAPTPAAAQFFFFGAPFHRPLNFYRPPVYHHYAYRPQVLPEELTPREIMASVQRMGFSNPSRPVYVDDIAEVTATSRDGRRLRLSVDVYSGRVVGSAPTRQQVVQRMPDQGAAVRRAVPESRRDVRSTPDQPAPTVRRAPVAPQQPRQAAPPKAQPAQPPAAAVQPGTRTQPRRIDMTPPAALDEVKPAPAPQPSGPPINSVPPAGLE